MKKMIGKPKKSLEVRIREEETNKLGRVEDSKLTKLQKDREDKKGRVEELVRQPGGRQALMDYIFGKSKENPLEPKKED